MGIAASLLTIRYIYISMYQLRLEWDKVNRGQLTEMTLVAGELLSTDFSVAWLQLQWSSRPHWAENVECFMIRCFNDASCFMVQTMYRMEAAVPEGPSKR